MNRAEFDAAMAANDAATLIENTFMARVPDLIAGGMSIENAIRTAKERDDELCLMMIAPYGYWQEEAVAELKREITEHVYERLRTLPSVPLTIVNPRWVACEAAIGREPTAHEFIMWHNAQRTAKPRNDAA